MNDAFRCVCYPTVASLYPDKYCNKRYQSDANGSSNIQRMCVTQITKVNTTYILIQIFFI